MQKIIVLILVLIASVSVSAQDDTIRRYYDTGWTPVAKEAAFYNVLCKPVNGVYKCQSFFARSGKLAGKSTFADSNMRKGIGSEIDYYEEGGVKDSLVFDGKGFPANTFSFRKNGTLEKHIFHNLNTNTIRTEYFDESGKLLPRNTKTQVPAAFEGGTEGWVAYLEKKLKSDIPSKKGAPVGMYTVVVSFVIGEDGKVESVDALTDPGYGTKEEAIRVIKDSPKWVPATENGKTVVYRHRQSISFSVTEEVKKKKN